MKDVADVVMLTIAGIALVCIVRMLIHVWYGV